MEITFLGTGAGIPSRARNVSAAVLDLSAECGEYWLIDCGEGTQHQFMRSSLKISKINRLLMTHLHGDHLFGLPGFLATRSAMGVTTPLFIYGPVGICAFVETTMKLSESRVNYPLEIKEIKEGIVFEENRFKVEAANVDHRVPSFGFRITEADSPGKLDTARLQKEGIPFGPLYGVLKQQGTITTETGRIIHGSDYLAPHIPGKIVCIIGDTKPCAVEMELAENANLLVHEATFMENHRLLAVQFGHSTAVDAARLARDAEVDSLVLTHISSRYQEQDGDLLAEAVQIFENCKLATDLSAFPIVSSKYRIR